MIRSIVVLLLAGCASAPPPPPAAPPGPPPAPRPAPFSTYAAPAPAADVLAADKPAAVLLTGATVMTAAGKVFSPGWVLLRDGRIDAVGDGKPPAAPDASVIDAKGRFITPGLIDTHSHMGVYPLPYSRGNSDGNEATDPTTPEVWAEHGFWPQDPALPRAVAGGITTIQVLPGSANLIGGRSFTAKLKLGTSARAMRFPGAPQGLKMACGENPKRVYGEHHRAPSTRMGNVYGYRKAFQAAWDYRRRTQKFERDLALWQQRQAKAKDAAPQKGDDEKGPDDPPEPPTRDFALETLVGVLDGKILVHNHCYRADEMNIMLDLAREYRFKIRSFHHAVEAYKLAPRLAQEETSVSTWADWWGFKMESYDGIPQNAALLTQAGARTIIHSDSQSEVRHLNQEAAKAMTAGRAVGIDITEDQALRFITANAAWALGIEEQTGTLTPGKMADIVVWDRNPFSVYAHAERVYIDGSLVFERGKVRPVTDFELSNGAPVGGVAP